MAEPNLVLGVQEMDDDHARLEALLGTVHTTADGDLARLLDAVAEETRTHFAHEEALMKAAQFPVLFCHMAQHKMILDGIEAARNSASAGDTARLRRYLAETLPELIESHIGSVDRVTAGFLKGEIPAEAFTGMRLPLSAAE